jgi:hypothetical protein
MANRKGTFIGAYVPGELKDILLEQAQVSHRTLSQQITHLLEEAMQAHPSGLELVKCCRCSYTWRPRIANPKNCANPSCVSPFWQVERRRNAA